MSGIRHIATSHQGSIFAVAEFEKTVYVCDMVNIRLVRRIVTHLDFGGDRLAISPDGRYLAVGAYTRYGLELYEVTNGALLWQRKDLKKIQSVAFNSRGDMLFVNIESRPLHLVEVSTGATIDKIRGIRFAWQSPDGKAELTENGKLTLSMSENIRFKIERSTFAILHVAFSADAVFLSESCGPLRAISRHDGSTLWIYRSRQNFHFLRLGFNHEKGLLFGVLWNYQNGGNHELCTVDPISGSIMQVTQLPDHVCETEFANCGSTLICSNGDLFDLNQKFPKCSASFDWAAWPIEV